MRIGLINFGMIKYMAICVNLQFFKSGDVLTYLTLFIAYIAYAWSVNRDWKSWKSLFISFKYDLKNQKPWLGTEYFKGTYKDKDSFNPRKIIHPLSFESLSEIIRRGVAEFSWIQENFIEQLSLFNERVIAFNDVLDYIKKTVTTDPIKTGKLHNKLDDFGLYKGSVEFDELKNKISVEKENDEVFYLAERLQRLHKVVHVDLIGNNSNEDKLHYLHLKISEQLEEILKFFDEKKPWFIKYKNLIIIVSLILFILVEWFFK